MIVVLLIIRRFLRCLWILDGIITGENASPGDIVCVEALCMVPSRKGLVVGVVGPGAGIEAVVGMGCVDWQASVVIFLTADCVKKK